MCTLNINGVGSIKNEQSCDIYVDRNYISIEEIDRKISKCIIFEKQLVFIIIEKKQGTN